MAPGLLHLEGVGYSYGERRPPVLGDLTLLVESGEWLSILGANGAGKSTLLRLMAGLLSPQRGRVLLEGEDLAQLTPRQRAQRLAFVPQDVRLSLPFTCQEIVAMGRYAHSKFWGGQSEGDRLAIERAMQDTSTLHLAQRPISQLSGGEAQRVRIAQALAQETKLLLLDEPTSHLDICFQLELMELLRRLQRERGMTIIIILHDLNLAAHYSQRLAFLTGSRLAAVGTPAQTLTPAFLREIFKVDLRVEEGEGGEKRVSLF